MIKHLNRRGFIKSASLVGGALWLPTTLQAEREAFIRENEIGMSKYELDTPALCIDLDKLEKNLSQVHNKLKHTGVAVRPHIKTHKCPDLAKMQMQAGAIGVCAAKLSEVAVMLENGVDQVLLTGVNVTPKKIKKAMQLRKKNPGFIQAVDNMENAKDLQEAAKAAGITADVVVDLDVIKRSGAIPGDPALKLAQFVDHAPNLNFRGILAYDGGVQHVHGYQTRRQRNLERMAPIIETYELMNRSGLNLEIFSGGGTGTYDMMGDIPGFTDVQVGSYLFMDCQYMDIGGVDNKEVFDDFDPSLTLMCTVVNANHPKRLITDAGTKAVTLNKPAARVIGESDFSYNAGSDEYGTITFSQANKDYKVGDYLEMIVPHCDPIVNLYDRIYGIRNEKVESIIPVLARGMSQ
jgi:D-serine deaminase-like pyridoxal phosphate-dependent protein